MPPSPELVQRIRASLVGVPEVREQKMFGGVAFMVRGNMATGVSAKGQLMVRVSPAKGEELVADPQAHLMAQGGRSMKGFVLVEPAACATDEAVAAWVRPALDWVATLPPK